MVEQLSDLSPRWIEPDCVVDLTVVARPWSEGHRSELRLDQSPQSAGFTHLEQPGDTPDRRRLGGDQ